MVKIYIPGWLDKELTTLSNHKAIRKDDLIFAAAILGWERLKDMTPKQIVRVLEEATLR